MNKTYTLLLVFATLFSIRVNSQNSIKSDSSKHLAVLAPLFLDSVFDSEGNYRYGKSVPGMFIPGLDVYNGLYYAIDSLKKEGIPINIHFFDTRSYLKLDQLNKLDTLKKMNMILGYVTLNEAALLARFAAASKIPFYNLNLPNDAGSSNNPYYFILNPTLAAHSNAIYKNLQKNYPLANILFFRKQSTQEDRLISLFKDNEKSTSGVPLKWRFETVLDTLDQLQITSLLDTSKTNICVLGSLDLNFSVNLCKQLAGLSKSYPLLVFGMPNLESYDFNKTVFKGLDLFYSSALTGRLDAKPTSAFQQQFMSRFFLKPGPTVFRSFEITYLLAKDLATKGNCKGYRPTIFGAVDLQPVRNKQSGTIDYFENLRIDFVHKVDGLEKLPEATKQLQQ